MILPIILFLTLHAGAPPTDWIDVEGAPLVRYRWSRPASNSCLVELENNDPTQVVKLNATANFIHNDLTPQAPRYAVPQKATNATIIRPQIEHRSFYVNLSHLAHSATSWSNCYGIVAVKAAIVPAPDDLKKPLIGKSGSVGNGDKDASRSPVH